MRGVVIPTIEAADSSASAATEKTGSAGATVGGSMSYTMNVTNTVGTPANNSIHSNYGSQPPILGSDAGLPGTGGFVFNFTSGNGGSGFAGGGGAYGYNGASGGNGGIGAGGGGGYVNNNEVTPSGGAGGTGAIYVRRL